MKSNILLSILCVVLLFNGLAILFWQKNTAGIHPDRRHPKISQALKINGQEEKVIDQLEKKHFEDKHLLLLEQKNLRRKLFIGARAAQEQDSILQLIGRNQEAIERMTYTYFKQIRSKCSPSQQKELNILIEKMIQGPQNNRRKLK